MINRLTEKGYMYHECDFMDSGLAEHMNCLSAYEDTGLEPGEITANMEMFAAYRHVCGGLSPGAIAKLVKAQKDGRLVVLPAPAKEGDPKPDCFCNGNYGLWCVGLYDEGDDEPTERCKACWYCESGDYADDRE